ncbi:MAG TPA: KEOPS complex subunit Cgi121 [Candidatus Baltobacteraceae bacterium]|nr:KEOPS complex subunit Cgi121 [Candidatus Baltobacteraceae bacterium]
MSVSSKQGPAANLATDYCKIVLSSSTKNLGALLNTVRETNEGGGVLQIFDPAHVSSEGQMLAAYLNARARFRNKTNRTRSVANEMLLFVALTNQLGTAIAKAGAKGNDSFVVFADTGSSYSKLSKMLGPAKKISKHGVDDSAAFSKMALLQIESG